MESIPDIVRFKPGQGVVPAKLIDDTFGDVKVNFVNAVYQVSPKKPARKVIGARMKKQLSASARKEIEATEEGVKGSEYVAALYQVLAESRSNSFRQDGRDIVVTYASVADNVKLAGRHDSAPDTTVFRAEEPASIFKMKLTKRQHGLLAWIDPETGQSFMSDHNTLRKKARSMLVLGKTGDMSFMMHAFDNGNVRASVGFQNGNYLPVRAIAGLRQRVEETIYALIAWLTKNNSKAVAPKTRTVAVSTVGQLKHPYFFGQVGGRDDANAWKKRSDLELSLRQKLRHTKFGMAVVGRLKTVPVAHLENQQKLNRIREKLRESSLYNDPDVPYNTDRLDLEEEDRPTKRALVAEFNRRMRRKKSLMEGISTQDAYRYLQQRREESKKNVTFKHLERTQEKAEPLESKLLRGIDRWKIDLAMYRLPTQFFNIDSYEYMANGSVKFKGVSFKPTAPSEIVRDVELNIFGESSQQEQSGAQNDLNALFAYANLARKQDPSQAKKLMFDSVTMDINHDRRIIRTVFKGNGSTYEKSFGDGDAISLKALTEMKVSVPFWWTTGKFLVTTSGGDPWADCMNTWEVLTLLLTRKGPQSMPPIIRMNAQVDWTPVAMKREKQRAGRKDGTTCKPVHRVPLESGECSVDPKSGKERFPKPNKQGDMCCFEKSAELSDKEKKEIIEAYSRNPSAIMPPSVLLMLDINKQPEPTNRSESDGIITIDDTGRVSIDGRLLIRTPIDKVKRASIKFGVPTEQNDARKTPLSRQQIATLIAKKLVTEQGIPEGKPASYYSGLYRQLFEGESHNRANAGIIAKRLTSYTS